MLATLLEVVGFVLVVAAAYLVSLPLALLVAGAGLLVAAQAMTSPSTVDRPRRRRRAAS